MEIIVIATITADQKDGLRKIFITDKYWLHYYNVSNQQYICVTL